MLYTKANPVGIDEVIQRMQTKLYNKLSALWPTGINYQCYGRCYRNKRDNGYVAEIFDGGIDYKEVYWDDTLSAISFFGVSPVNNIDTDPVANIHLVFFLNLNEIKPPITLERADEEARLDVYSIIKENIGDAVVTSISTGIENILKEYPGSYRDNRLKVVDMHPVHCFRYDFSVRYNPFRC